VRNEGTKKRGGEREKGRKGEREKGRKGEREKGRKGEREIPTGCRRGILSPMDEPDP
jgi:hypothetical protein